MRLFGLSAAARSPPDGFSGYLPLRGRFLTNFRAICRREVVFWRPVGLRIDPSPREKILAQNPYTPPTRKTKNEPKPRVHAKAPEVKKDFLAELRIFLATYWEASAAYRGGNLKALDWFPEGCYPPALPFLGAPAPPRPPSPATRRITVLESGKVERGEIPVVKVGARERPGAPPSTGTRWDDEPRARGQPG